MRLNIDRRPTHGLERRVGIPMSAWRILACVLPLTFLMVSAAGQDIHQLARAVDDHYNRLRTLQTDFVEVYRGNGLERQESGTLWLKKPRKMRWEYRSPREKLFVSDGQEVWLYLPAERQLRKTEFKKLDDLRSPLAFLLGKTKLENELEGISEAMDQSPSGAWNVLVRGVPKGMKDRISDVLLEINPSTNQMERIVLTEVDGATTEFRFTRPVENRPISDTRFQFTPPSGVEVLEGELGP